MEKKKGGGGGCWSPRRRIWPDLGWRRKRGRERERGEEEGKEEREVDRWGGRWCAGVVATADGVAAGHGGRRRPSAEQGKGREE